MSEARSGLVSRETSETRVEVELTLDGPGPIRVKTGIGFFDHMLHALAFHAGWGLELVCEGDLGAGSEDGADPHWKRPCAVHEGGAVTAAQRAIARHGLEDSLGERIERGRLTLAICLGMQLMARGSEEAPGVPGLGVFDGIVGGYESGNEGWRVPQMGWNRVVPADGCEIVTRGYAYFANSYRLTTAPDGWLPVWCEYAGPFLAAVERGPVVGCQFHPELSGDYGTALLTRWLEA